MTLVKSSESAPSALCSSECVITNGRSSCENVIARDENAKLESDTELGAFKQIWNAEGTSTLVSESQNTVVEVTDKISKS